MVSIQLEQSDKVYDRTEQKRQYQRQYNKTPKGKEVKRGTRKSITDAKWLSRKFVAIDGEGINIRSGAKRGTHLYVMLAISGKPPLISRDGLRTRDILRYLFDSLNVGDINVIYGGSYDFNNWLRDLTADEIRHVYKSSYSSDPVTIDGYGIRWIKGKALEISRVLPNGNKRTVTVNDVISFFQRPFIQACDEYLGEYNGRETLVREKARRGDFRFDEMESIGAYNNLELDLLVRLMGELRLRLNRVGLRPRRWNSPGAIASALFNRESVKDYRNEELPDQVMRAARFAYAGGRFEMIKYGAVKERVYEYDINSAYPRALLEVPSLRGGKWSHYHAGARASSNADRLHGSRFGMYRVRYTGTNPNIPGPVFVRSENGTISYPLNAENWIWTPEYEVLKEYCAQVEGASFELLEAWTYEPANDYRPFAFIQPLYNKRQELKAKGDGAHVGIKLALNSIYGKLAQQVGWKPASGRFPMRVPTYHQLEWAGYVTSWCRANVLRAALTDIESVIAFETDALFTSRPLSVAIGTGLGEWEVTKFRSLTYVQSGHYYGTDSKGKEIVKCRGVDKGSITRRQVEKLLGKPESHRVLQARLTRFYGAGIALMRGLDKYWCKWLTEPKNLQLMPTGKRVHGACWCNSAGLVMGSWHNTFCPVPGGVSNEYPVEWINPNPNMTELTEFRESENFYDD